MFASINVYVGIYEYKCRSETFCEIEPNGDLEKFGFNCYDYIISAGFNGLLSTFEWQDLTGCANISKDYFKNS